MSKLNPILASSAHSAEAYRQAIAQSSEAVVQWLQQPDMYQGKSVAELRERIKLDFTPQGLGNQAAIERAIEYFLKTVCRCTTRNAWRTCTARAW